MRTPAIKQHRYRCGAWHRVAEDTILIQFQIFIKDGFCFPALGTLPFDISISIVAQLFVKK
jgi:hypothetical protein